MVCGAIAYGLIIAGKDFAKGSNDLKGHEDRVANIILGKPLVQAVEVEKLAAPFGIYVHDSARSFPSEGDISASLVPWKWWVGANLKIECNVLLKTLEGYMKWAKTHPIMAAYKEKSIARHMLLAEEYFELI